MNETGAPIVIIFVMHNPESAIINGKLFLFC